MGQSPSNPWHKPGEQKPFLYSVKDASRLLGIGKTTTWSLIKQGSLETRKIGARTLVTADSVEHLARLGVRKVEGYVG